MKRHCVPSAKRSLLTWALVFAAWVGWAIVLPAPSASAQFSDPPALFIDAYLVAQNFLDGSNNVDEDEIDLDLGPRVVGMGPIADSIMISGTLMGGTTGGNTYSFSHNNQVDAVVEFGSIQIDGHSSASPDDFIPSGHMSNLVSAEAGWSDQFVIVPNDLSLIGRVILVDVLITVDGSLSASLGGSTLNSLRAESGYHIELNLGNFADDAPNGEISVNRSGATTTGVVNFPQTFVLERRMNLGFDDGDEMWPISLEAYAELGIGSSGGPGQTYTADTDLRVTWAGIANIRLEDGTPVPLNEVTTTSLSGFNYVGVGPPPFRWTNSFGGDWSESANWLAGREPGNNETAEFDLPGVYTVRLTSDTTNAFMQVSGASAAEAASPRLQLIGNTYQAQQIAVQAHGELQIDGFSGLVRVDHLHVAAGGRLDGMAALRPATAGGVTNVTVEGDITMGRARENAPQRRAFLNTDGGPEPAEFFAHFAVRGNYTQDATGTMHVVLTPEKAVNESAIAVGRLPAPPRSAELLVTGDASLAGKLVATTSPGYVPQHGDKFVIIDSLAPINSEFAEYDVPNAFNGLPLKTVKTGTDVQLVTPQKVVFAWGHDAPFGMNRVHLFGTNLSVQDASGTTPALRVPGAQQPTFEAFQEALLTHVEQQFTDSGIQNIVIETGAPDPNAINLYFIPDDPATTLLGRAVSGVDRFNEHAGGAVIVHVQNFNPAGPANVELDAETVTHEIGHVLGLRHVDPAGAISVMDYDIADGDVELFQNDVFNIKEKPEAGGTVFTDTHNPQYHLRRYVDGWSHDELVAEGIMPGTWDLPENVFPPLLAEFSFFAQGITLYDASVVFTESAPDEANLLAHFESITLEALGDMSFEIQKGNGIGLVAASTPGGPHDIALLAGDPEEESQLLLYPEIGVSNLFLQRELLDGFETLSAVTLTTAIVPEPVPGDHNADGSVDAADYVVWRKTDGSQAGYSAWRGNFGRTASSSAAGSASGAVPEPQTVVLLLTAMLMTIGRRRVGGSFRSRS